MRRFSGSWFLVLIVGGALFELLRRTLVRTQNPNLVPALLLLGASIVPAAFVIFISNRRLRFTVAGGTVALIALIGGVVGIVAASTLEYDTMRDLGTLPMSAVGLIEEAAKLIAPITVLLLSSRRRPADGLLVGVASGAGFAALETMGYAFVALVQSRGDLAAVDGLLLERGLLSPAAHMAWTGLTSAAIWTAAQHRRTMRSAVRPVLAYLVAAALHTAWDSVATVPAYATIGIVSLGLLTLVAHRVSGRDRHDQPLPGVYWPPSTP